MIVDSKTENSLCDRLKMLDELLSNIPIAVYRFRMQASGVWSFDFVSSRFSELTGLNCGDILNDFEAAFSIIHPEEFPEFISLNKSAENNPVPFKWEGRAIIRGEIRWIRVESRPERMDNADLVWSGYLTDITERKRMEEELKHNEEEKFRTVADFTYDWEYWISPFGRLIYVSPSCERISGYHFTEFINEPSLIQEIIHPEDRLIVADHFNTIDSGDACELDFRIITRTGETRWIGHTCQAVYRKDGVWLGRRVSNRDITERKRMDEVLKQKTDDLERSNKDLEQFAYVAAHDLREPLVAVAAYLKVLERLSKNLIDDNGRTCIVKAISLVLRMDAMLQALLGYSRLALTPTSQEFTDSNTCLMDAISNLGLSIKKSGAIVTNDTLPTLKINAAQLVVIFQNLIGNAIKYRETEPLRIHIGCVTKESQHQFSVSDNGIGIEPPYLNRIFNMFERVKDLSGPTGTGIGLSTCRKIVERYGGRMWVDSSIGKGSTFYFTLPKDGHSP